jgi:hypothetical protein
MKPATLEAIAEELLRIGTPDTGRFPDAPSTRLDALIATLADEIRADHADIRSREAPGEIPQALRRAVAEAAARRPVSARALARRLARTLDAARARLSATGASRTIVIGCTLLPWQDFDALAIGPIGLRARLDWLRHEAAAQGLSAVGVRRIEARWRGERRGRRRPSRDATLEREIVEAIGDSRFVCSVTTRDLSEQAALDRSLDAARLTLAGLALLWKRPSLALAGMSLRYDQVAFRRTYLAAAGGRLLAGGARWSQDRNGAWMPKAGWTALLSDNKVHLHRLGEVMRDALAPDGPDPGPSGTPPLYDALLWFEAACREETDRFAVAKFAAALEALDGAGATPRPLAPDTADDWAALRDRAEALAVRALRVALVAPAEASARDEPLPLTGG